MSLLQLPTNEVLLTLLGFGLGIAATIISQLIMRRLKFKDAHLKLRYANLKKFRIWMEAYRDILKCKYPNIRDLWLSQVIAPSMAHQMEEGKFKQDQAIEILRYLKEYREAKRLTDKAREVGEESFAALAETPSLWNPWNLILFIISPHFREVGTGIRFEVIGHLRRFHTKYNFLYDSIEKIYAKTEIEWDKLDTVQSDNLESIISHPQLRGWRKQFDYPDLSSNIAQEYRQMYDNLADAIGAIQNNKNEANYELERIFTIIRKYESKWIVPNE